MARKARLGTRAAAQEAMRNPTAYRSGATGADFAGTEAYSAPERESRAAASGTDFGGNEGYVAPRIRRRRR